MLPNEKQPALFLSRYLSIWSLSLAVLSSWITYGSSWQPAGETADVTDICSIFSTNEWFLVNYEEFGRRKWLRKGYLHYPIKSLLNETKRHFPRRKRNGIIESWEHNSFVHFWQSYLKRTSSRWHEQQTKQEARLDNEDSFGSQNICSVLISLKSVCGLKLLG